jgi:hypothetical protein
MKLFNAFLIVILLIIVSACTRDSREATETDSKPDSPGISSSSQTAQDSRGSSQSELHTIGGLAQASPSVSLAEATAVQAAAQAADRKIIRNGELTIETDSPADGQRKITAIAETNGGFVVTSEFKRNDNTQTKPSQIVTVVVRVPASQFGAALDQIRAAGERVIQEKVTGQDVSEEYLDLEARIRSKKALEAQFLEIMKQAKKVPDALEVQSQLSDVRTEIERLEGRRRFLENQSALSTITITLQMPVAIVAATTSGLGHSIRRAFGDAVDVAVSIILFFIQAVIVLIPIVILIVLPAWVVWRVARRRMQLHEKPEPVTE